MLPPVLSSTRRKAAAFRADSACGANALEIRFEVREARSAKNERPAYLGRLCRTRRFGGFLLSVALALGFPPKAGADVPRGRQRHTDRALRQVRRTRCASGGCWAALWAVDGLSTSAHQTMDGIYPCERRPRPASLSHKVDGISTGGRAVHSVPEFVSKPGDSRRRSDARIVAAWANRFARTTTSIPRPAMRCGR